MREIVKRHFWYVVLQVALAAWSAWQYRLDGYDQVFIWPLIGLMQGALIVATDRRMFVERCILNAVIMAGVAISDFSAWWAFGYQIITVLAAVTVPAVIVRSRLGGARILESYAGFLRFTFLTFVVAALAAVPTVARSQMISSVSWQIQWTFGFLDVLMNIFLFAPLYVCLAHDRQTKDYFSSKKWIELLVVLAVIGGISYFAYGVKAFVIPVNFVLLPIYIFIAMRHGLFGASLAIIVMTLIALAAAYTEPMGYLHNQVRTNEVNLMMVFGFVNAFVMFSMAVIGRQENNARIKLAEAQEKMAGQQKRELVDRMADGIAHDVNNLLVVVGGYSEMLAARVPDDEEAQKSKNEIFWAIDRVKVLLSRVSLLGKEVPALKEVLPLGALVEDFTALAGRMLGEGYRVSARHFFRNDTVCVDKRQIEQVLLNLFVNAKEAMPIGGEIVVTVEDQTIRGETFLACSVRDHGTGVSDELKEKIFEPFFTQNKSGGTGLGLTTSRTIMRRHDGDLFVRDGIGGGAEFVMLFRREENGTRP